MKNNFQESDTYEKMQFYYPPDHLGSSSYITNLDGEVVQHIEYVPFGEVFVEERNNIWNTPYLLKGTTVYTYGRYQGGNWYTGGSTGSGVLVKYNGKNARRYITAELYRMKAEAFQIKDASDAKVSVQK